MHFELYEDYKRKSWNLNMKVSMISLLCLIVILIIVVNSNSQYNKPLGLFILGIFIVSQTIRVRSFVSKYEHSKGEKGRLSIGDSFIIWNKTKIAWNQILDININFNEIDNKQSWKPGPSNNVSDGFNLITIETTHGEKFEGHYKLSSKEEQSALRVLLEEIVVNSKLKYDIAKKIVQPKNYNEVLILKDKMK